MVFLKSFRNTANGALLVVPLHNCAVDNHLCQGLARRTALHQQLQLVFFVKTLHWSRRVGGGVPKPMLVAIGGVNQRTLAKLRLQTVCIQLGLLLPHTSIAPSAFGFHHSQGFAIVTPKYIVHIPNTLVVRHALHFVFTISGLVKLPARFFEQQVNVQITRLRFVVIVSIWCGCVSCFGNRNFSA